MLSLLCKINYNCNHWLVPSYLYPISLLCKSSYNCNAASNNCGLHSISLLCKSVKTVITVTKQTFYIGKCSISLLCKINYNCNFPFDIGSPFVYHYSVKSITTVTSIKVIEVGFCDFSFNLRLTLNYLMSINIRSN